MAAVSSPEWSFVKEEWDVFLRVIAFSLVWTTVVSSLVLLASSLAARKSFALLGTFAFVMLSGPVAGILHDVVDPRCVTLAILMDLEVVATSLFGQVDENLQFSVGWSWAAITAFTLGAWAVIAWRLKRLEVVA